MLQQRSTCLLFIDTNILLDFYRAHQDSGLSLISKLQALHKDIITTPQVEMEFKRNRQVVMAESVEKLKTPNFNFQVPAILAEEKATGLISKQIKEVRAGIEKLHEHMDKMIRNAGPNDPIYVIAQGLFEANTDFNLKRDTEDFRTIKRRAWRRFLDGSPPRKVNAISIGDSLNWEWILECIRRSNRDVIVVSRDGDYGLIRGSNCFLNDWLQDEVRKLGHGRSVRLFRLLSEALATMGTTVTSEERESEEEIISSSSSEYNFIAELRSLPAVEQETKLECLLSKECLDLVEQGSISDLIARTNADGWGLDTFDMTRFRIDHDACHVRLEFWLKGDQKDDRPWCGTAIHGTCIATI